MRDDSANTGLLLVAHGTRDTRGIDEFRHLAGQVRERLPTVAVCEAFIELAEPGIIDGLRQLADRGVTRVVVSPLLLFAAGHAKRDIPAAIDVVRRESWFEEIRQTPHFGCDPCILDLSWQRFEQRFRDSCGQVAGKTMINGRATLIIVGRGSCDASASAEMMAFSAARRAQHPEIETRTAFLAMATPAIQDVIDHMKGEGAIRRVVVQPHLLFQGRLLDELREKVRRANSESQEWSVTEHLGPDASIAKLLADRFVEILTSHVP